MPSVTNKHRVCDERANEQYTQVDKFPRGCRKLFVPYVESYNGMKLFGLVELEAMEDVYRFALGLRNANGKSKLTKKLNSVEHFSVRRFAKIWITVFYLFLFISRNRALGQEQFEKSLQENEHLWHPNVKEVGCETQFNKQPHDPDTVLFVKCSILFADRSPDFRATLRFCPTFQTCDAAGGKFKDIVIGILKKRIGEKLPLRAKK